MTDRDPFMHLADDSGKTINWKFTSILMLVGMLLTLATVIAGAGAKSERLERLAKQVDVLETKYSAVDRVEVRQDEIFRRLGGVEAKIDQLLERHR